MFANDAAKAKLAELAGLYNCRRFLVDLDGNIYAETAPFPMLVSGVAVDIAPEVEPASDQT